MGGLVCCEPMAAAGHHRSSQVLFFQSATTVDGRNPANQPIW